MRIVYLGTSGFAAGVLRRLAADGLSPQLVVTRPDRPAGRGRLLTAPPVAEVARELGVALHQPEDVNDAATRARIVAAQPEGVAVCAFGALVTTPLLSDYELVNVHPSLLPRWRGAAPIERAIMAGDERTGVSIMRLTEGLDEGPVSLVETVEIAPDDTYGSLSLRLEQVGAGLLARALRERPSFSPQASVGVTYAAKIVSTDRTLDAASSARERERVVRALHPHIGARLRLDDGSFLGVLRARVAHDGSLELLEVQPPGGRPMSYAEYARGHRAD